MKDLESRIREVLDASVAHALPGFDVVVVVRRRHWRRMARVAVASVAAAAAVVTAAVLVGVPGGAGEPSAVSRPMTAFPGGGRILFADSVGLKWLYPDGRTVRIADGFSWAAVSGFELIAWNDSGAYAMSLDGTGRHRVLAFVPGVATGIPRAGALSPGGSRLAYYAGSVLWAADLLTGRRTELGRVSFAGWRDDATILASSSDESALLLINAATSSRSTYLSIRDLRLARAYQQARPGAGRPVRMASSGFNGAGTSAALAVTLAAPGPFGGAKPAEVILNRSGRSVTYAPTTPQQFEFTWGPDGLFVIETGAGDNPGSWNAYVGAVRSGRLSAPVPYGADGSAFNPAGSVIALQDGSQVTFVPTPRPACQYAAACSRLQPKYLTNEGTLIAWVR